ncbi:MAG: imidazolonepropionase [Candidatus Manganitrophaceae bacterium]
MNPPDDLAITHCGELLTLASGGNQPKRRSEMSDLGLVRNGAVAISHGKIAWVGTQREYRRRGRARREIDASGKVVMPGFVDPHTHAIFAGSREREWAEKLRGVPYLEILQKGGGILNTVQATRAASLKSLTERAEKFLKKMLSYGTTTVEIKSGYGLDLPSELKILKVIERLADRLPLNLIPTFMGAHAIPKEYSGRTEAYIDQVIKMIPAVRSRARFCDLFCEEGAFNADQSRRILEAAKREGFAIKLHAGEFSDQGGVRLAAEFGAVSVDHLDHISSEEIPLLAESGAVGVLLPGVSHFLMAKHLPPVRALIEAGVPIALATDFNPGSSPSLSMQEIIHLAVRDFKLTVAEAISAATINAAHGIGMGEQIGSLEVGKQADILILDLEHHAQLPYFFGVNHMEKVLKRGKVVYQNR